MQSNYHRLPLRGAPTGERAEASATTRRGIVFRNEGIGLPRIEDLNVTTDFTYGVELELFFPSSVQANTIISALASAGLSSWSVKNDNSIVCNPSLPSCYKAEIVSPVLQGKQGLRDIFQVLQALRRFNPSVNKTTGLHVHLKPRNGEWQLQQLKNVAYNFVQLETGFDKLVPNSRRDDANNYCKSNVITMKAEHRNDKKAALNAIKAASSIGQLMSLVCPDDRYYKLNLRALDRHGTIEFRHAGGTTNPAKVAAYVILYLSLAQKSATGALAKMPKKGYAFQNLEEFLSFNHVLLHWLDRRYREMNPKRQGAASGAAATGHTAGCGCAACRD